MHIHARSAGEQSSVLQGEVILRHIFRTVSQNSLLETSRAASLLELVASSSSLLFSGELGEPARVSGLFGATRKLILTVLAPLPPNGPRR